MEKLAWFPMKHLDFKIELKFKSQVVQYTSPLPQLLYLSEAELFYAPVFQRLSLEEFLLIFFALLNEFSLVVVSLDRSFICGALASFLALLQPLQWSFPVVYNLPQEFLHLLESPVPLVAGLNISNGQFYQQILRKVSAKTK